MPPALFLGGLGASRTGSAPTLSHAREASRDAWPVNASTGGIKASPIVCKAFPATPEYICAGEPATYVPAFGPPAPSGITNARSTFKSATPFLFMLVSLQFFPVSSLSNQMAAGPCMQLLRIPKALFAPAGFPP